MNISAILCTYNRCQSLAKTLESIASSQLPESVEWEVLVVDNNSNDQTREVAEQFCRRYPGRFRYLFEPQQGKSYALNTGIREAQGEVLAFVDDDVTVQPTWLWNLTAALRDSEWAGVGGRIVLSWPAALPNWLSTEGRYARHMFPGFDQGREAKELIGPPFGTNMAFRKSIFEKYGGFRADLGPRPGSEIRNEDTEFGRRLIAAGEKLRYEPNAIVYHPVPEDRIKKELFLAWWFDKGRGDFREFGTSSTDGDRKIPVRLLCSLAVWVLRWMKAIQPRVRFHRKLVVWEKVGVVVEYWNSRSRREQCQGVARRHNVCRSGMGSPPNDVV